MAKSNVTQIKRQATSAQTALITALATATALILSSCASSSYTSLTGTNYASRDVDPVVLFTAPEWPAEPIGLIQTDGAAGGTNPQLIESMKAKARQQGAEAVMVFSFEARRTPRARFDVQPLAGWLPNRRRDRSASRLWPCASKTHGRHSRGKRLDRAMVGPRYFKCGPVRRIRYASTARGWCDGNHSDQFRFRRHYQRVCGW